MSKEYKNICFLNFLNMETLIGIQNEKTTNSTSNFDNLTVYGLIPQKTK